MCSRGFYNKATLWPSWLISYTWFFFFFCVVVVIRCNSIRKEIVLWPDYILPLRCEVLGPCYCFSTHRAWMHFFARGELGWVHWSILGIWFLRCVVGRGGQAQLGHVPHSAASKGVSSPGNNLVSKWISAFSLLVTGDIWQQVTEFLSGPWIHF